MKATKNNLMTQKMFNFQRRAQLQIMENVFILLVIFVILIFAFLFVVKMQKDAQKSKLQEFNELELIKKSKILNFLPEMQCSNNNNIDPYCYDMYKIQAFTELVQNDVYYAGLLGKIKLSIKRYDPDTDQWSEEWQIYDSPKDEYKGQLQLKFPISLYNTSEGSEASLYFGIIYISVYQ